MIERRTSSLSKFHQTVIYLTTLVLWVSGGLWFYWQRSSIGPDGLEGLPHPAQVGMLRAHGGAAMIFMIVLGTLIPIHMRSGWRRKQNRASGGFLVTVFVILILTGWGLYYAGSQSMRQATSFIHTYLGLGLPLIIYLHVLLAKRSQDYNDPNDPQLIK